MKKAGISALIFVFVCLICLCTGRYPIQPGQVLNLLAAPFDMRLPGSLADPDMMRIFWNIRVPRLVLSLAAGAGISTAGAVFQALFRNPLASPDILGVTAGASFGAAFAIIWLPGISWVIQGSAFFFGILAVSLAYILASGSRDSSAGVLVISGIVISAVFQAGLSILMYMARPYDQLSRIVFWTMGSFNAASWKNIQVAFPILVPGILLISCFSWRLNIMTQDEEDAVSMGVNILWWRIFYVLVSTLMVACSVACVGRVAWIGLIVPHIARYLVGPEHSRLVPWTAFLGGIFLMLMDSIARSIMLSEIPISIVTSVFGAPFLGYLVISAGKKRTEA